MKGKTGNHKNFKGAENQSKHNVAPTFSRKILDETANPHDWLIRLRSHRRG